MALDGRASPLPLLAGPPNVPSPCLFSCPRPWGCALLTDWLATGSSVLPPGAPGPPCPGTHRWPLSSVTGNRPFRERRLLAFRWLPSPSVTGENKARERVHTHTLTARLDSRPTGTKPPSPSFPDPPPPPAPSDEGRVALTHSGPLTGTRNRSSSITYF